jgi:hypothetical protein
MSEQRMKDGDAGGDAAGLAADLLDVRVVRALERKAEVDVPAGFAARVAGQAPMRRMIAVTPARYGLMAARIGMAVLLLALVVVAMRSAGHTVFGVVLEWLLCAQLMGLSLWLGGFSGLRAN